MANLQIDMGSGIEIMDEVHRALETIFGPFDRVGDILVEPNPNPSTKIAIEHEDPWVRASDPMSETELLAAGGWVREHSPFGRIRSDSLAAKFLDGEMRLNTKISDLLWCVLLHDEMQTSVAAGDVRDALQCAARMGYCYQSARLNATVGLARVKELWNKGAFDEAMHAEILRLDAELRIKEPHLSKRKRAKQIADEPGISIDHEAIRKRI